MCPSEHFYIPKQNKKIDENTFEFRENGIGNIIDLWVINIKNIRQQWPTISIMSKI